jgi:hypothetical protein
MDNTVGSLTQFQRSVIIGCVLGDGYLRFFPGRKNALLEINHSAKAKDYVDWKYFVLKDVAGSPPKIRKGNGKRVAYRFYTKELPELTVLLNEFYRNGKKIIPDNLVLDPIILAVWFMDDGSRCGPSSFYLNTQQYSLEDQKKIIEKLKEIGLEARLNRDKSYWRIRFLSSSVARLRELIADKIIPSMKYKIELNPVETWSERA